MVHVLRGWRLGHQAEHERHDRFALLIVEGKLRHPIPLVVGLVFRLFVVVTPRSPELLPEEALPLVAKEFLEKIARIRIDRLRIEVPAFRLRGVRQFRRELIVG